MINKTYIQKLDTLPFVAPMETVTVKKCGNILETVYLSRRNTKCAIKKLDKETYVKLSTGEIKNFKHNENRKDDLNAVRSSLKRLKDYINTNCTKPQNCRWITLTYAENMKDTKRLYLDFNKFTKRLKYRYGTLEYIVAMEPQGRGAWHAHLILIFPTVAPYIDNAELKEIWGQGYVSVKQLKGIDNIGAYLTAYLGDMELNEDNLQTYFENKEKIQLKTVTTTENGKEVSKRYIKGARLALYPVGFNLYRISKGIKKPKIKQWKEFELQELAKRCKETYKKAIQVTYPTINGDINTVTIFYRQYLYKGGG